VLWRAGIAIGAGAAIGKDQTMPDPLKKALDLSQKIVKGVDEGQSNDAPIDLPGTHRERSAENPGQVVDKRTGKLEKPDKDPDNLIDRRE
jgi:hypothetical protein